MRSVPKATLQRYPIYLKALNRLEKNGIERVMSKELALMVDIEPTTIRRDFSFLGNLVKQGYGYSVKKLIEIFNRPYPCAVCGDISEYSTDAKSRVFKMRWVQEDDCKDVKNIVFIPQLGFTEIDGKKGENSITMKY